jgi:hypothetical protein
MHRRRLLKISLICWSAMNRVEPRSSMRAFRSLAGAVRESCAFVKGDKSSSSEDYLEFQWADYLRTHWAQTGIPIKDIDTDFDNAIDAALHLAAQKDAASLPG